MQFTATIPDTGSSLRLAGNKGGSIRLVLEIPEIELPNALPLVTLRGQIFEIALTQLLDPDQVLEGVQPLSVRNWASIAPRANALRISGLGDGLLVMLDFPGESTTLLHPLAQLRGYNLKVAITENVHVNPQPGDQRISAEAAVAQFFMKEALNESA